MHTQLCVWLLDIIITIIPMLVMKSDVQQAMCTACTGDVCQGRLWLCVLQKVVCASKGCVCFRRPCVLQGPAGRPALWAGVLADSRSASIRLRMQLLDIKVTFTLDIVGDV